MQRRSVGLIAVRLSAAALASCAIGSAIAQDRTAGGGDAPPFTIQYEDHLTVREDRTATEIASKRIKVLTANAVQTLSQQQLQFVERMETLETLEAYTEKPDGRRVAVDPASIMTRDGASNLAATYAPDLKVRTVIFPDVGVGDTLVMTSKQETLQGVFPGQFMDFDAFPRSQSLSSVHVTIEAPASLDLSVKATGNATTDDVQVVDGVRRHEISVVPAPYAPEEPGAVSPLDRDPMLSVSTFHSYEELGDAYGKTALPKTAPTPEIIALAAEITRGMAGRMAQAVAIDAWVKKNIRYVAVFLSVGRIVPHEAASVLRNKFGDCKDKATLMMALLAAKGIESEAALINLGNAYSLPEPPTLAALNHVILFLPQLGVYDDPTASVAAFGVLAPEAYDKPVVRVSAAGAKLARTPPMDRGEHLAHSTTTIHVAADGAITGRTREDNTGVLGIVLRYTAGIVQQVGEAQLAQRTLQYFNTPGSGQIDLGNSAETVDPVTIQSEFTLNNRFKPPAPGGGAIIPVGMPFTLRPGNFLFGPRLAGRKSAFVCLAGIQIEDIEATFDAPLPLPARPGPLRIDNAMFTYSSTFEIDNRTLKIHRRFESRTPGQSCPPETEALIGPDLDKVRVDVNGAYRFPGKAPTEEFQRVVVAGQKRQLDFFYDINSDCSSQAVKTVAFVEQPRHGKVAYEPGTGTSSFPAGHLRAECNGRQNRGALIMYEPAEGFTGDDSATVNIVFVGGDAVTRRYNIVVGPANATNNPPAEAKAPSAPPSPTPSNPPIQEVTRVAVADQTLRVAFLFDVNPDCSVIGIPTVHIVDPPKSGRVTVEKGDGFPTFPTNNIRVKCNDQRVEGGIISYTPNPGFTGADSITVEIINPDGTLRNRRYAIEVK